MSVQKSGKVNKICYFRIGSPKELEYSGQLFSPDPDNPLNFNNSQQVESQGYKLEINPLPEHEELSFPDNNGNHYQRTGFEIKFQHNFGKYLMNYYIPSGILVIFSWVSEKIKQKTQKYIPNN